MNEFHLKTKKNAAQTLENYAGGNGSISDGWNILRYYQQGFYRITKAGTKFFTGKTKVEYCLLRAAKAGEVVLAKEVS